jgi:hypothetical protein
MKLIVAFSPLNKTYPYSRNLSVRPLPTHIMKSHLLVFLVLAVSAVTGSRRSALAEEPRPALPLSKAAKLAEDAIASASLPANCFLRSIALIQNTEAAAYYRATYKPLVTERVQVGTDSPPPTMDVIHIALDGKVSFEHEALRQRSIQVK